MTLPPVPPRGNESRLHIWLGLLKSSFDSFALRLSDSEEKLSQISSGVTIAELEDRLSLLEENTGTVQRIRLEHYDYPNDTYDDGTSSGSPVTLATISFTPKKIGNTLWVTGSIAHSTGTGGPDSNGAVAELYINGVKVDSRVSFIDLNAYSLLGVFLFWEIDTTDVVTLEIKAWSTVSSTRFRSPGTYFVLEEVKI